MANLFDYLKTHGDTPFSMLPFTEADNLALAQLAYCDLGCAVGGLGSKGLALGQVWALYAQATGRDGLMRPEIAADGRVHRDRKARPGQLPGSLTRSERLLCAMALSRRFGDVLIAWFEARSDAKTFEQFAAYTALLPDGSAYVSFRGTDSRIAGWRENFMMSYMVVGAQASAKSYLDAVGGLTEGALQVGGHSKGGNLAAYAAAFCDSRVQSRITDVWCNDPPGFVREVVDFGVLGRIAERMHLFVPEFCVVGGIMEQVADPVVIRAEGRRYLQHDLLNWRLVGGNLERGVAVCSDCKPVERVIYRLIYSHTRNERVEIVNELFDAFMHAGVVTVYDFASGGPALARRVLERLSACDKKTRKAVRRVVLPLAKEEGKPALAALAVLVAGAIPLASALM